MHALETDNVLDLAARVRRASPDVPIVIGGHTAAAYPDPFLAADVTAVVIQDGERVMPRLVRALEQGRSLTEVAGLVIQGQGGKSFPHRR